MCEFSAMNKIQHILNQVWFSCKIHLKKKSFKLMANLLRYHCSHSLSSRDSWPLWCSTCGDAAGSSTMHPGWLRQKSLPSSTNTIWPSFVTHTQPEGSETSNCWTTFLQRNNWWNSNPTPLRGHVPHGEIYIRVPCLCITAVAIESG